MTSTRPLLDRPPRGRCLQAGLTLVEMAVAVSLASILLAVAVPSFTQLTARMRIEGAGHNLAADLQLARAEAVSRRATVSLTTLADGSGYTLTSGGATLKSVGFAAGVSFSPALTVSFDPLRGLASAAVFNGSSAAGSNQLRVSSDVMGRVQMCSPDGVLKGYAAC